MAQFEKMEKDRVMKQLNDAVSDVCVTLAVDLNRRLKAATPVATGLAASNWIARKGAGTGKLVSPPAKAAAAQSAGIQDIRTFDAARDGKIIIENNTPYISDLNNGASRKAPVGFVQGAIARAVGALRRRPRGRRR